MVGPKEHDFWHGYAILKGKKFKKFCRGASVRQKLGMILENKVVQKLTKEKKCFNKKLSPKLIFFNEFFFLIPSIFDIKN